MSTFNVCINLRGKNLLPLFLNTLHTFLFSPCKIQNSPPPAQRNGQFDRIPIFFLLPDVLHPLASNGKQRAKRLKRRKVIVENYPRGKKAFFQCITFPSSVGRWLVAAVVVVYRKSANQICLLVGSITIDGGSRRGESGM